MDLKTDDGATSTIEWRGQAVLFIPTFTATAVSGPLKGATAIGVIVPTGITGNCLLNPVRSVTFLGIVTIIRF